MIRSILRWTFNDGDTWYDAGRRMKLKMNHVLSMVNIRLWESAALKAKWKWAGRLTNMHTSRWAKMISTYHPADILQHDQINIPRRSKGRPRLRWEDDINPFCRYQDFSD